MTPNLEALNLWFFEDSNKMVVETCKKIPITIAFMYKLYLASGIKCDWVKLPNGMTVRGFSID